MKKLILSVLSVGAISLPAFSQSIVLQDNSLTASYDVTIGGVPDTATDINLELLAGSSPSSINTPIITLLLNSGASSSGNATDGQTSTAVGDIVGGGGLIFDPSSQAYSLVQFAGTTTYFKLEGWSGSGTTFGNAPQSGSVTFSESIPAVPTTGTDFPNDISNFGVLNLTTTAVPEPSTFAMAGVGLASMLIFRRRK